MTNQLEALIAEMKAAAENATPGEWWADVVETEGSHGNGEDCVEGFHSYAVYDQNNHSLLDMTNSTAAVITVEDDGDYVTAWDEVARRNAEFIALANPSNILALIAALEQSQRANAAQDDHINQQADRIEQLEKGHQEAAKHITSWRRLAKQNIAEREKDIAELYAARKRIAELEPIRVAAEKLVRCKGRYHSELNYRALAALFGVITPDLPPLDGEDGQLAVKLPHHATPLDAAAAIRACMDEFPESVQDIVEECAVIAENTIRAAGGTVQGDE